MDFHHQEYFFRNHSCEPPKIFQPKPPSQKKRENGTERNKRRYTEKIFMSLCSDRTHLLSVGVCVWKEFWIREVGGDREKVYFKNTKLIVFPLPRADDVRQSCHIQGARGGGKYIFSFPADVTDDVTGAACKSKVQRGAEINVWRHTPERIFSLHFT